MRLLLPLFWLVWLASCGYVGDPLAPALNVPKPVLDLRVIERGRNLEISFTMPFATGEGLPIREAGTIDLRVGGAPAPPFDLNAWLAGTSAVPVEWPLQKPVVMPQKKGTPAVPVVLQTVTKSFNAQSWAGKDVILGVRLTSPSGRLNAMSNLVAVSVIPPLTTPADFAADSQADGIHLKWTAPSQPGVHYRVTRQIGDAPAQTIADLAETQYLDLVTAFGPTYRYTLQGYVRAGDINAVSEPSANLAVPHIDHFAPGVPTGLAVLAGAKTIELGWDRNTDADLAKYRVYRASGDGVLTRVAEVEPPAFRDAVPPSSQRRESFPPSRFVPRCRGR